ncbi:MAG: 50S ribosomal protein L25/general stress protein Ctc [Proteobacteria bacterium]|nr:50S ribosomal protein L25/general stress protein Ctc [Pseudomonadota bacterium]
MKAGLRKEVGTGGARAVRRQGNVPAVIYGGKEASITISLEARAFAPVARAAGFFNHLVDIDADGKKIRVLPRDVQFDPVSDQPVHADFLRVSANTRIRVYVPVVFFDQDKSPGLKRGGALNIVQHQLLLVCAPEKIPENIRISVDGLDIGDAIHMESIKLPPDVKPVIGARADTTIASIAAPTTVQEEEPVAAAVLAEGEAVAVEGAAAAAAPGAAPAAGAAPGAAPAAAAAAKPGAPAAPVAKGGDKKK